MERVNALAVDLFFPPDNAEQSPVQRHVNAALHGLAWQGEKILKVLT